MQEPFFSEGVGTYLGILEDVKRKAYEGFVLSWVGRRGEGGVGCGDQVR